MGRKLVFKNKSCIQCGKYFNRKLRPCGVLEAPTEFRNRKYCSKQCHGKANSGENNHFYKDGIRHGHDGGYLRDSSGQYIHRLVMEKYLGRKLETYEEVHHKDENVLNNSIENLQLVTDVEHGKIHYKTRKIDSNGRFCG